MGAGSSSRFGGTNKLLEPFADVTVGERVLNILPFDLIHRSVLVTGSDIEALYSGKYNIQVLINSQPTLGIGRTVKSDWQPLVTPMTVICLWCVTSQC